MRLLLCEAHIGLRADIWLEEKVAKGAGHRKHTHRPPVGVCVAIVSMAKVSIAIVRMAIVSIAIVSIAIVSIAVVSIAIARMWYSCNISTHFCTCYCHHLRALPLPAYLLTTY